MTDTSVFPGNNFSLTSGSKIDQAKSIDGTSLVNTNGVLSATNNLSTVVVTSGSSYTAASTDEFIVVNKGTGSATAVTLPASPVQGQPVTVKDGKGDAGTNNITVSAASGNIDGSATNVINSNLAARRYIFNGTQWNVT